MKSKEYKKFIDHYKDEISDDILAYDKGLIYEDGFIHSHQFGAEQGFFVGMPIYSLDNEFLGYLEVGVSKNLDYATDNKLHDDIKIPVESWRVANYKSKSRRRFKTYFDIVKEKKSNNE